MNTKLIWINGDEQQMRKRMNEKKHGKFYKSKSRVNSKCKTINREKSNSRNDHHDDICQE